MDGWKEGGFIIVCSLQCYYLFWMFILLFQIVIRKYIMSINLFSQYTHFNGVDLLWKGEGHLYLNVMRRGRDTLYLYALSYHNRNQPAIMTTSHRGSTFLQHSTLPLLTENMCPASLPPPLSTMAAIVVFIPYSPDRLSVWPPPGSLTCQSSS